MAGTKGSLETGSGLVGVGELRSRELAGGVDKLPPHVVSTGVGRQLGRNPPTPDSPRPALLELTGRQKSWVNEKLNLILKSVYF